MKTWSLRPRGLNHRSELRARRSVCPSLHLRHHRQAQGVIRTSGSLVLLAYLLQSDWGFGRNDLGLLVMPMCHANSLYFAYVFAACGAGSCVYDRKSFEPEHLLRTLASDKFTFTSLVPTHYIMMLGLPESVRRELNVESVTRLLISSAPARQDTKLALIENVRRSQLYEAYGSTEAGWVTLLRPEEQLTRARFDPARRGRGRFCHAHATGTSGQDICSHGK